MNRIQGLVFDLNSKKVLLVITFLMAIILIDTFLIKFYDLVDKNFISVLEKKIIFSIIAFVCLGFEFIMINYVKKLILREDTYKKASVNFTTHLVSISYLALTIIFSLLIFQIYYFDYYDSFLLMMIIAISFGVASVFIAKTLILFVSWFRLKRNYIFLLYLTSMAMILANLIITNTIVNASVIDRPSKVRLYAGGSIDISSGKYDFLTRLFKISSILSFASIWLTSSLLMYSSKDQVIGKLEYWIVMIIPLAYFIVSYFAQDILSGLLFPYFNSDPILTSLVFTSVFILSKPIGAVVFGISFWRISKLVSFQKILQQYVIISGYGFLLLFSANQAASLVLVPYPPFGVTTITVLIIGTFFIYTGIYKSATMVSTNTKIRKSIYELAKDSKLLNISGRTEMEREIENTVDRIIQYGGTPTLEGTNLEMDKPELKNYVEKVIQELRNRRDKVN